ncbi:MAG TPA: aminodeoxychorismate/anthranilate synthase component II [Syntrophomonadaceae bacterium]|nr:aminodeoxychorismate/anthranilate synthase component II [Syntrophomonadaceae bacterium]
MILVIDNYDSFTFNLVQYLGEMGQEMKVYRNDAITLKEIEAMMPTAVILSPGPCTPNEAGICLELVACFSGRIPILGVCLGHQAIGQAFGGEVVRAHRLMHGKTSMIYHDGRTIYKDLRNPFEATRYHSLILRRESLPECLEITAETDRGEIMGIRHRELFVEGVQFHPESILTGEGKKLLRNFVTLAEDYRQKERDRERSSLPAGERALKVSMGVANIDY